jgi:ABC-type uncharacterized transport system involved in gliding motility auxiliary subunit
MEPARISKQGILRWLQLGLLVCFFTGVLVLINIIGYKHNGRFDLTPGKSHTLSQQSVQLLNTLTNEIKVTVFYKKGEESSVKDLLELFSRASDKFSYTFIDLDKNPARAQAFGIRDYGTGVAEYQQRRETIRFVTEENLVNTILRLTDSRAQIVRFVTGHGEKSISSTDNKASYSSIKKALELENYTVEEFLLLQARSVPDDTMVLIIGGPQKDFLPKELDLIDAYIKNGGRVLFLLDPAPLPALEAYLKKYWVALAHDFIVDRQSKLLDLDEMTPLIVPDKNSPITNTMNEAVIFPVCRSVIPLQGNRPDGAVDVLAESGPESWAERNTSSVYGDSIRFDRDVDLRGPVPVAVTISAGSNSIPGAAPRPRTTQQPLRVAVMGNSSFITNQYLDILGNKDFFLNTVNWLAERKKLITIRPKTEQRTVSMLFLTEGENRLILWSAVIIQPAIILFLGIAVTLWRRKKR